MKLEGRRKHGPMRRARAVDALKQRTAKRPSVNHIGGQTQPLRCRAVKHAAPFPVPLFGESVGVLKTQQGLSFAIAGLLAKERTRPLPPVMPHECARRECNPLARLL